MKEINRFRSVEPEFFVDHDLDTHMYHCFYFLFNFQILIDHDYEHHYRDQI